MSSFHLPVHILQLRSKRWVLCSEVVSLSIELKMSGMFPLDPSTAEGGAKVDWVSSWSCGHNKKIYWAGTAEICSLQISLFIKILQNSRIYARLMQSEFKPRNDEGQDFKRNRQTWVTVQCIEDPCKGEKSVKAQERDHATTYCSRGHASRGSGGRDTYICIRCWWSIIDIHVVWDRVMSAA